MILKAEWYPLIGGMQDVNYWRYGCMEITLEVSCCKYPPANELLTMWNDNKKSMIEYLKMGNTGLKGIVKFKNGNIAKYLAIKIDSREPIFKTTADGEYFRVLLPGNYTVSVLINCKVLYQTKVSISKENPLKTFNLTLPNRIFLIYKNSPMDSEAEFCKNINNRLKKN